jgi:hypothetical protein
MSTKLNINAIADKSITADKLSDNVFSGSYPEMSVGKADSLGDRPFINKGANFVFRATADTENSIKDGIGEIVTLYGNSVVWNQLTKINAVYGNNAEITIDRPSRSISAKLNAAAVENRYGGITLSEFGSWVIGHKYLIQFSNLDYDPTISRITIGNTFGGDNTLIENDQVFNYKFLTAEHDSSLMNAYINAVGDLTEGAEFTICDLQIHDLTLMFEAGNEPSTIEEYNARKPIIANEYAYNKGEVIHMTAEGIKSVGDNAWDEQWELGYINPVNGNESDSSYFIRSKNYCRIIGGEEYHLKHTTGADATEANMFIVLYDENHSYLDYWGISEIGRTIQFDSRAQYFKVSFRDTYGTTYKNDVMISLMHSGWKADTDAGYQPYWEDRLMFDQRIKDAFPNGMRKWDKVYNKGGKGYIVKGTGVIDMGELYSWYSGGDDGKYWASAAGTSLPSVRPTLNGEVANILCSKYTTQSWDDVYYGVEGCIGMYLDGQIGFVDSNITSVDDIPASLYGTRLYYELAEPEIIEYDEPFDLSYKAWDFGTEELLPRKENDKVESSSLIIADIRYNLNEEDTIRDNKVNISRIKNELHNVQRKFDVVELSSAYGAFELHQNKYYTYAYVGAVNDVTFDLITNNNTDEFLIEIQCQYDATIAFPLDVQWANESLPPFVAGKTYIISIVNNLAVFAEF